MSGAEVTQSSLKLGWETDPLRHPRYDAPSDDEPDWPDPSKLVTVKGGTMAANTVIIGGSGSGKSFFLGCLLEELVLRTQASLLILDPNADFRKFYMVEDENLWKKAKYDRETARGKLPTERCWEDFAHPWTQHGIRVQMGSTPNAREYELLSLPWSSVPVDLLTGELDAHMRSGVRQCHEFVRRLGTIVWAKVCLEPKESRREKDLLDEAEKLFEKLKNSRNARATVWGEIGDVRRMAERAGEEQRVDAFRMLLAREVVHPSIIDIVLEGAIWGPPDFDPVGPGSLTLLFDSAVTELASLPKHVPSAASDYYFLRAREFASSPVVTTTLGSLDRTQPPGERRPGGDRPFRVRVVDLPSFRTKELRLLAVSTILAQLSQRAHDEWSRALEKEKDEDMRVPWFIVLDEAHNLIPGQRLERAEEALVEQFRTIAAEGRKYGLFLILATQRPDKLDPLVLGECKNMGLMKLSGSAKEAAMKSLRLSGKDLEKAKECDQYEISRVLLIGEWSPSAPSPKLLYSAARRTVEGGRNLRAEHWATPLPEPVDAEPGP